MTATLLRSEVPSYPQACTDPNSDPNGRCVRRIGRTFLEGDLESMVTELRDDAQEALGQRRPSGLLVIHEESRLASERVYGFSTTPEMNQYGTLVQI